MKIEELSVGVEVYTYRGKGKVTEITDKYVEVTYPDNKVVDFGTKHLELFFEPHQFPKADVFDIKGVIDTGDTLYNPDVVQDMFLEWVESNDWSFGGGIKIWEDEDENN